MPSCPSFCHSGSNEDDEPKEGESFSKLDYNSDDDREPEDAKYKPNFNEATKYNPQITRVKKKGRFPTDIPCLILFVLYCLGMIAIAVIAFKYGTPSKLYCKLIISAINCILIVLKFHHELFDVSYRWYGLYGKNLRTRQQE